MLVNICGRISSGVLDPLLQEGGYAVVRRAVPGNDGERALRLLNLEIVRSGLTAAETALGSQAPYSRHLRWEPEVPAVRGHVERVVGRRDGEEWADAQLPLRFPDPPVSWPLTPLVDEVRSRGAGRRSCPAADG